MEIGKRVSYIFNFCTKKKLDTLQLMEVSLLGTKVHTYIEYGVYYGESQRVDFNLEIPYSGLTQPIELLNQLIFQSKLDLNDLISYKVGIIEE